jgi:hypothetical protein
MGRERVEWCGMLRLGRIIVDDDAVGRGMMLGKAYCLVLRDKCDEGARCMVLNVCRTVTVCGSRAWSLVM